MKCGACDYVNPADARFCAGCGARMAPRCPACAQEVLADAAFCHHCGAGLRAQARGAAAAVAAPAPAEPPAETPAETRAESRAETPAETPTERPQPLRAPSGELRQVTVLFADLVDSTGLTQRLDIEDYRRVLAAFKRVVVGAAEEFGGRMGGFAGDGGAVFFGYPVAFEDAAVRAIHCARAILRGVAALETELAQLRVAVQARLSVHTGAVVVDDAEREGGDLFGEAPNVAERLKQAAQPGDIVVSDTSRRLAERRFMFADIGEQTLRGVERPVRAYLVVGLSRDADPMSGLAAEILGRGGELAVLRQRWESAAEGEGQLVLLSGEAGIGKSALIRVFRDALASLPHRVLSLSGSTIRQGSAFHVLRTGFERFIGAQEGASAPERAEQARAFLAAEGLDADQFLPALAQLLDFEAEAPLQGAPQQVRRAVAVALATLLDALDARDPLLIVVEDLHWVDPSTIEFLSDIADMEGARRRMMVATYRPDYTPTWRARPNTTALMLSRLSRRDTMKVIAMVAGKPLPPEVADQIAERTDGVPLFIEELTKMVIESGLLRDAGDHYALDRPLPPLSIPVSLQDSLMARLDRLAAVKDVAQIAAAIGRRFPQALLRKVSGLVRETVDEALAQLTDAELIFQLRASPDAEFEFKHALVQDAAYHSLLRSARREWHGRIAETIARDFPDIAAAEPEVLAHHWTEARRFDKAECCWTAAAGQALARSANLEAITHFEAALACIEQQPPSAARDRRELDLRIAVAVPLATARGYAHESVRAAYARAQTLCDAVGETERLFRVVYGLCRHDMMAADHQRALKTARRLSAVADEDGDPAHQAAADRAMGSTLFYLGDHHAALERLDHLARLDLSAEKRREALSYDVVDFKVAGASYASWLCWLTGRADDARAETVRAIALGEETGHLFSLALARAFASWTAEFCGDLNACGDHAQTLAKLSRDNNFGFWTGWAQIMEAIAADGPDTTLQINEGLALWRGTGARLAMSYFLWLKARTLLKDGDAARALSALSEAERLDAASGERWWRPEVLRLRARIEGADAPDRAATLLGAALKEARALHSPMLALRATCDLSAGGDRAAADALAPLLAQVAAGGETADTARARGLLRASGLIVADGRI